MREESGPITRGSGPNRTGTHGIADGPGEVSCFRNPSSLAGFRNWPELHRKKNLCFKSLDKFF